MLGILKTTLGKEISLTNQQYSLLVTAFMVPYTAAYFFVGDWIDRWGAKAMLAICVTLMSLATIASGLASSLPPLLGARFVLGLAEAGVVPAITVAIFSWFPSARRAFAYSLANTVQQSAYILCPPFVAAVTLALGWRWTFLLPGSLGLLVVLAWLAVNRAAGKAPTQPTETRVAAPDSESSWWQRMRGLWGNPAVRWLIVARIISDPFWFFFQYWQTAFLQERVGLSLERVGQLAWIPPLAYMVTSLGFSALSDRLIARGWRADSARLVLLVGATALAPATFLLPQVTSVASAMILVTLVWIMCATWLNMSSVFMGALVPRTSLASAIGLMSALGGITSILFNAVVGTLIDHFGYDLPLYFGAFLHPVAALLLLYRFSWGNRPPPSAP